MGKWLQVIKKLAPWQKLVVAGMLVLILMTWSATCLILAGVIGP